MSGPLHVVLTIIASRVTGRKGRASLRSRVWHTGEVSKRFDSPRDWLTLDLRKGLAHVGRHG